MPIRNSTAKIVTLPTADGAWTFGFKQPEIGGITWGSAHEIATAASPAEGEMITLTAGHRSQSLSAAPATYLLAVGRVHCH